MKVELAPNFLATKHRRRRRPLQNATCRAAFEAFSVFPDYPLMMPLSVSLFLARNRSRREHELSLAPLVITWLAMSSAFIVDTIHWFCFRTEPSLTKSAAGLLLQRCGAEVSKSPINGSGGQVKVTYERRSQMDASIFISQKWWFTSRAL